MVEVREVVDMSTAPDPDLARARITPHPLRLMAFVADLLFVFTMTLVPGVIAAFAASAALERDLAWSLLFFLLVFALAFVSLHAIEVWLTGQTPGKAMFGLTVRRADGSPPRRTPTGLVWAAGRPFVGYLLVDVFGLGSVLALTNPRHRCLHDLVFGSEVLMLPDPDGLVCTPVDRLRAFQQRLETASEAFKERYGWLGFLWTWHTKIVGLVIALFLLFAEKVPGWIKQGDSTGRGAAGWSGRQMAAAPVASATPQGGRLPALATTGLAVGGTVITMAIAVPVGQALLSDPTGGGSSSGQPSTEPTSPEPTNSPASIAGSYTGSEATASVRLRIAPAGAEEFRVTMSKADAPEIDPGRCRQDFGPPTEPDQATVTGSNGRYEGLVVSAYSSGTRCYYQVQKVVIKALDKDTLTMCGPSSTQCPTYHREG